MSRPRLAALGAVNWWLTGLATGSDGRHPMLQSAQGQPLKASRYIFLRGLKTLPNTIGIIPDGNRRFAKKYGL
ncbi:MAG: hypothetical protein RXO24_07010, partial [Acidilobus sp.]